MVKKDGVVDWDRELNMTRMTGTVGLVKVAS